MRLRNNQQALTILQNNSNVILDGTPFIGKWNLVFNNDNPIYIEIGSGKGDFCIASAELDPNINYIAIERNLTVGAIFAKKISNNMLANKNEYKNLRLLISEADLLKNIFSENEISKIYLNFVDPWPKNRHEKKRLLYKDYLNLYATFVKPNTEIEFKTDNDDFYNYCLSKIQSNSAVKVVYFTNDLYKDNKEISTNVVTEYEKKFVSQNKNINKIRFILNIK